MLKFVENVDLEMGLPITNDLWVRMAKRKGDWELGIRLNLLAIRDWWVERKRREREERQSEYEYYYECGCPAIQGAYYNPRYCPKHGMYLMQRKKDVHKT